MPRKGWCNGGKGGLIPSFLFHPLLGYPLLSQAEGRGGFRGWGLWKLSLCIARLGKGLYLPYFVPFAVRADSAHVYFIRRGGCLVSLSSDVISAPRAGPAVLSLMNSAVALLSPPRYQSSRCQIKPGRGKERENKAQKEEGRGRVCVVGVPLVLGFPLFLVIFPFKLFPLQLGFLFEAECVVAPEVMTLSVALGPLLLGREEGCPLFIPAAEHILASCAPAWSCPHCAAAWETAVGVTVPF